MQGCSNCGTTMQTLEYHGHSGSYCSMNCLGEKEMGGGHGKPDPTPSGPQQLAEKTFGPQAIWVGDMTQYAEAMEQATGQEVDDFEDEDEKQDAEFQS